MPFYFDKPADTTRKPTPNVVLTSPGSRLPTDSIPSGGGGGFQLTTPEFTPIRLDMGNEPQQTQSGTSGLYSGAPTMPAQVVNAISQGQPPQKKYPPDPSKWAHLKWRQNEFRDSVDAAEMQRIGDSLMQVARESAADFHARKAAEARAAQEAQARSAERPVFRRAPDTTNTVGGSQPPTPTQHPNMPKYSGAPSGDAGDAEIAEWLKTIPPEDRVKISRHEFPNAGAKSDYLWRSAEIYMNRQQGNSGKKKK